MIKVIVFDWFGVCTKENWGDCVRRELREKLGADEEAIKAEYRKLLQPFARAELSPDKFLEKLIGSLDKSQSPEDFRYLFDRIPELNEELLQFILQLKKRFRIFLLSNNFVPIFPKYEKLLDFPKHFHEMFLSHKLGLSKTQNEVWDLVLSKADAKPEEILFIDNKEKYLEYPKGLGVNVVLFKNNEQLRKEMNSLGI